MFEETDQLSARDGTTCRLSEPLYWTRLWKTWAKWTSTVKNPYCGSIESKGPLGNSSTSWLLFFGARPGGPDVEDEPELDDVDEFEVVEFVVDPGEVEE